MWQPPSAGTVATHLGVGRRFLPGQATQGPMVVLLLYQPQSASKHQPLGRSFGQSDSTCVSEFQRTGVILGRKAANLPWGHHQ